MTEREVRVLQQRGLTPAARMILFYLAHSWEQGQEEMMVNKVLLARQAESTPDQVRRAIMLGESAGLLLTRSNGRVAFTQPTLPILDAPPPAVVKPITRRVVDQDPPDPDEALRPTVREVQDEFGRQWKEQYQSRYLFEHAPDGRTAARLAKILTRDELPKRVRNYLRHPDPFYARCAHSFSLFARNINQFGARTTHAAQRQGDRVPTVAETKAMLSRKA